MLDDKPRILSRHEHLSAPSAASGVNEATFGRLLKEWRARRGLSQLELALAARTTQRHLSFIESGRATPSRDMVLRISGTMDIPLRQQNALLLAAGYAPVWRARSRSARFGDGEHRSRLHPRAT